MMLSQDLDDQLRRCTVRLRVSQDSSQGTGFWVAPGLILTCAHVVETAWVESVSVDLVYEGRPYQGTIARFLPKPYPDLALLECAEFRDHPCVYLHDDIALPDQLYSYGYTDQYPQGDSATFEYEGPAKTGSGTLWKLKEGQARPGLSGAPLLNLRTGGVCGIVKSTRNRDSDLGGRAIPITCMMAEFDLTALQQSYHGQNSDWLDCLNDEQQQLIPWQMPPSYNPFYGESETLLGRDDEIRRILEKLHAKSHCSIVGPPGSGKTRLLQELRLQVRSRFGWHDGEICRVNFRGINTLKELQQEIVDQLGGEKHDKIQSLLKLKPLPLLLLDNLGGMEPGNRGLTIRRWLRSLGQDRRCSLVTVSNERLEILFRQDDPARDSPFADIDPLPVELSPLDQSSCHQLVQQRLTGTSLPITSFKDLFSEPQQPRELLKLCARRYEELQPHRP